MLLFRTLAGVFAIGMILIGLLASLIGGFNATQLYVGVVLTFITGWIAFRRHALIWFSSFYWLSIAGIVCLSAPWLPLVTAVDQLAKGTPREEVVQRLAPWLEEEKIPKGNESSAWSPFNTRTSQACRSLLSPPEAMELSFRNNRLQHIKIYWD
ncbi:MAG: hypothetical protein NTX57_03200 [Armatimonadetes bacterium]|nr:hypothetical protein [Armatimonadota bacterium]